MKLAKQRALYMNDKDYQSAQKDATKAGMSFSCYINELMKKFRLEKSLTLTPKK